MTKKMIKLEEQCKKKTKHIVTGFLALLVFSLRNLRDFPTKG